MSGIVLPFIKSLHAYDLADTVEKAIGVFDRFEIDYDFVYLNIISQADANEVHDTIEDLNDATRKLLDQVLKSFSVVLVDEAPLNARISLIEGLAFIEDYEDKETVSNIFENHDVDPIDRAVDVLQLTTAFSKDELYDLIVEADIDYLAEEVNDFTPSEADISAERAIILDVPMDVIIREVRRFVKYAKNDDLYLIRMIRDGIPPGRELEAYAGLSRPFDTLLPDLSPEEASLNMILASIASGTVMSEKILTQWQDNIDRYVMDAVKISKIMLALRKQLVEFEQYEKEVTTGK